MKLKESVKNTIGVILFYGLIVLGVVLINARMEQLNQQKSAIEPLTQIAQKQNR